METGKHCAKELPGDCGDPAPAEIMINRVRSDQNLIVSTRGLMSFKRKGYVCQGKHGDHWKLYNWYCELVVRELAV